jgi:molybdopterin-guanine dinucleotide biosynthesis protein A
VSAADDGAGTSAIVLAGGRSSRFGADKLAAAVGGGTLLDAAIRGMAAVAIDIVVVRAPGGARDAAEPGAVRSVEDPEPFGGPLVGLLAGLEAVRQPIAVVAGGDMPDLSPEVLAMMLRTLHAADDAIGAVILERRGRPEPLPAVVRVGPATDAARRLLGDGERSLRALFERLPTRFLAEATWRPLDPAARTLHDVDVPADLDS